MALPTNADVIVVHGYWLDELTGLGVKQSNGRPATIMFDPVPLLGANATKTPNLRDLTSNAHLKTRTRVATVDPVTGYYAAQLVASNDPDLDAYSGRKVTFLGEDPFTIEVPYNAPTATVSAEMAAKTGLTQGSSVKAIWLPNASVTTIPTPTPAINYLSSAQTLANIAAGIETHDEDPAAHADIRALIGTPYTDEQARDTLAATLVAGSNVTITPNDGADTITISATVPSSYSDEQAQDAFAALIAAATHSGISFSYNDAGNALSATVSAQSWSQITGKPSFATVATTGAYSDLTGAPAAYTDEQARDALGAALVAGSNITITPNDGADTITIAATGGGSGSNLNTVVVSPSGGDDTSTISTAMDTANTAGTSVFLSPGTYSCGSITKAYAPRIWAVPGTVVIQATNTSGYVWNFAGTLGSTVALTANASRNAWTVTTGSTTGIAAGDLLLIGDQTAPYSTQSTRYQGQSVQVQSVDSGTQLTLTDAVYNLLTTASSAFYAKITPVAGCRISGIKFRNTNATSTGGFLRFTYCRDVNVQFDGEGSGGPGIRLEHCYNFQVDTFAKDYYDNGQTGLQQFGYGAEIVGASSHGDVHVRAQRVRHAVSGGGIDTFNGEPVNVRVTGVAHGCTGQSWDWHAQGCDIVFADCLSYASRGYGFALRGRRQHIIGGNVSQGAGGVWMFEHPGENRIDGLRVTDVANTSSLDESGQGGHGILITAPAPDVTIRNNEFLRVAQAGITISGGGLTDGVIEGNHFRNLGLAGVGGTKTGVHAVSGLTRTRINRNIVEDNQGTPTTLYGFTFDVTCTDTTLSGNRVHNSITSLTGSGSGTVTVSPDTSALATVATSGAYTDLTGKPTIPSTASDVGAAPTSRTLTAGTGLSGGGDLTADRTFAVAYGTTGTTAAVGNDSRLSDTRTPTDGTVTDAKVASGAAIALSKLATDPLARANHTGTQAASTVTGLATVATSGAYADLSGRPALLADATSSWRVSGIIASTTGTRLNTASSGLLVSGRLTLAGGLVLPAGQTISSITFGTGGTGVGTPTNQWFCLVDKNLNILAKTNDDTTTAWGVNSTKTLTIAGGYTPGTDIAAYAGIVVAATTVPTIVQIGLSTVVGGLSPMLAATANTGLTNPASLTAVGTLTALSGVAYAHVS